jgi:MoxR-like ATPase
MPEVDPKTPDEITAAVEKFRADHTAVREEIGKVIVGHHEIVYGVLTCLFCDGHALLEGVPGLGKTLLVRTLADALQLSFNRVQFTPDLMPSDVTGTTIVVETGGERSFRFQKGPIFTQILLADEINRATPKTQSALLEAMQERSVTVDGVTHTLEPPFLVMATQNPIEQEGTYPLPEAQLDRFFFKLQVGYSSRSELAEILDRTTGGTTLSVKPVLDGETIRSHQRLIRRVAIADHVRDYAVRMTLATHPTGEFTTPMATKYTRVGSSPRAAQALTLSAKCRALLEGRSAVSVDDIRQSALPALRHRIVLNFEAEAEGVTTDAIIENIVATMPVNVEASTA